MSKTITVRAIRNIDDQERGWDTEETRCDTIKEAKSRAKYFLTEEYRNASEASERLTYAQVVVDDVVMYDYFR